jgi:hypothetical protein
MFIVAVLFGFFGSLFSLVTLQVGWTSGCQISVLLAFVVVLDRCFRVFL